MAPKLIPVDPFDLIIFGGNGDLALRKLMPALYHRDLDQQLPEGSRIIAVGRSAMTTEAYLEAVLQTFKQQYAHEEIEEARWQHFASRVAYIDLDALDPSTWEDLITHLSERSEETIRAIYLATPPAIYGAIAQGFKSNNLLTPNMRIVLEKPVGEDFDSAEEINNAVGTCFNENQIFRIDHYLGKETVQNILALRFGNAMFEPLWRREVVDHVQITVAEDLGVGNRIEFYNQTGALRDMVQNHILQLLCLVAMEPPSSLDDDAVRDEKIKVLRALRPISTSEVAQRTVRGQYNAGALGGEAVQSYAQELGGESTTETYVSIKAEVENWRWSGVPFYLRTGKRLPAKHSEIVIHFKPVPHSIFAQTGGQSQPNKLTITLQPNEGVTLSVAVKEPGPGGFNLKNVALDLSFEETFNIRYPDAYERLLIEVLRGNPALFMRRDEIEAAWQWVDEIRASWDQVNQIVEPYFAGSWGPTGASMMLDRDGRKWDAP